MTARLPGGDPAWFVRTRDGLRYQIRPASRAGWLVVVAYVAAMLAALALLLTDPQERLPLWLAIELVATLVFVVIVVRTSAPEA